MDSSKTSRNPSWRTAILTFGAVLGCLIAEAQAASPSIARFHRFLGSHTSRGVAEEVSVDYGDENEHDGEEHHVDAVTMDTTVAVIVIFLIVLTILFEYVKEFIEEAADRNMKPVIQGLFGELTVLGFLSMVTFLMTKMGWFSAASEFLFGEADEEELFETFEFVHYMLFFIMVFFVINVLVLVRGGQAMEDTWWTYNAACRDQKYMAQLHSISPRQRLHQTSYLKYLGETCFPCWSTKKRMRLELQLFCGLRQEFVLERSADPPFVPNGHSLVDDKLNFGRYLSICLGHELSHMVHVSTYSWAFLGVLTLIFYGIALVVDNSMESFAWIWACFGWLVFLLGNYFDYHMVCLLENMGGGHTPANEKDGWKSGSLLDSSLPAWTRVDLEQYWSSKRPLLARWCLSSKMTITRQDTMYWMERKGPKLYLILFQIQMVFTAAYVSLLILSSFPFMFTDDSEVSDFEQWSYVVLSLLPVFLLFNKYHTAAANLTMACSIGVHRRPQVVSQVIREGKTDRIIRALVILQKLQRAASDGSLAAPVTQSQVNGWPLYVTAEEVEQVTTTFDALDLSGDGNIKSSELGKVLHSLGAKATEESLAAMVAVLDKNQDGNISRDEFLDFYKQHMVFDLDRHGLHELARHMFEQFDSDGNGVITLSEFKTVMDALNVDFSIDEIGELVNELDEDHDGTICEHQFVELLKKHDHLFEQIKLPKLE